MVGHWWIALLYFNDRVTLSAQSCMWWTGVHYNGLKKVGTFRETLKHVIPFPTHKAYSVQSSKLLLHTFLKIKSLLEKRQQREQVKIFKLLAGCWCRCVAVVCQLRILLKWTVKAFWDFCWSKMIDLSFITVSAGT